MRVAYGRGVDPADEPGPFVALVDLKRDKELPSVWVVPCTEVRGHAASPVEPRPYRYRASEELSPHEEDWDAVEEHLVRHATNGKVPILQRASATSLTTACYAP